MFKKLYHKLRLYYFERISKRYTRKLNEASGVAESIVIMLNHLKWMEKYGRLRSQDILYKLIVKGHRAHYTHYDNAFEQVQELKHMMETVINRKHLTSRHYKSKANHHETTIKTFFVYDERFCILACLDIYKDIMRKFYEELIQFTEEENTQMRFDLSPCLRQAHEFYQLFVNFIHWSLLTEVYPEIAYTKGEEDE